MYLDSNNKFIESNGVRCIDIRWFQDVGIAISQDMVTLEYKAYLKSLALNKNGSQKSSFGGPMPYVDETIDKDVVRVMAFGAKYPLESAKLLFPQYEFIDGDFFEDIIEKYPEHFI